MTQQSEVASTQLDPESQQTPPFPWDPDSARNNFGYHLQEWGGNGDCAFRAVADGRWWNDNPKDTNAMTQQEIKTQAAWLRTQSIGHLRKYEEKFKPFFDDIYRGKSYEEWLTNASAATYSINGMMFQALSEKTGTPIIIFQKDSKATSWQRFCVAPAFSAGFAKAARNTKPVVICLSDKHYQSLRIPHGVDIPRGWLRETVHPTKANLEGAGKRKARGLEMEDTEPSTPPPSVLRTPKGSGASVAGSLATPSLHTVVHTPVAASVSHKQNGGIRGKQKLDTLEPQGAVDVKEQGKENPASRDTASQATPSVHTVVACGNENRKRIGSATPSVHTVVESSDGLKDVATALVYKGVVGKEHEFAETSVSSLLETGGDSSGSTDRPLIGKTCETWQEAQGLLQTIQAGLRADLLKDRKIGVLQSCLLMCSSLTRSVNDALAQAFDVETPEEQTKVDKVPRLLKPRRLRGKQPPGLDVAPEKPPIGVPLKESYSWKCNLCDCVITGRKKGTFFSQKSRHIERVHKDQKHLIAERRRVYPLIEVSDLPWKARNWTCG